MKNFDNIKFKGKFRNYQQKQKAINNKIETKEENNEFIHNATWYDSME